MKVSGASEWVGWFEQTTVIELDCSLTLKNLAWVRGRDGRFSGLCGVRQPLLALIVGEQIIHFVFFRK
jgi:hypothetical protein